ncbi:MAG: hypothetical protein NUV69_02965 [Candidatus Curtissbacteria bacterium]|nr:hypothetical protein [Candidatus Curtissbacteria bacterium]
MQSLTTEIFVLCDYAMVSREQTLSILGIFDQFFVTDLPTSWPKMFLVAVLVGDAGKEYDILLKLTPPQETDQSFPDKELKVALGPNGRANLITELVNFPLPLTGTYKVEILTEGQKVGGLEFKVNKTTPTYQGQDLQGNKVGN